jgi:Predicted membrane protein (DUF2207) C-terminal domain/Predicted membrane protein (DUF2207) N-terminal domain
VQIRRRRRVDIGVLTAGTLAVGAVTFGAAFVAGKQEEVTRYWTSAVVADDGSAEITEVIDYDFGLDQKHGIFRWVPGLDPAAPITVSSPDAPDHTEVSQTFETDNEGVSVAGTNIRVGDPDRTISGERRYRIGYDLPDVRQGETVDWEAVGTGWEVDMKTVEVHLVTPFALESPLCVSGPAGSEDTCDIREVEPGHVVATVEDLGAHEGVSVEGTQGAAVEVAPAAPDPPAGRPADDATTPLAPAGAAAGAMALAAIPATGLVRRAGRERVYSGGAADAAFGGPPLGGAAPWPTGPAPPTAPVPGAAPDEPAGTVVAEVRTTPEPADWAAVPPPAGAAELRVDASELEEMATIEFAPPAGLSPAHGGIILREQVQTEHKVAWLIQAAVDGVVELDDRDGTRLTRIADAPADPDQQAVFSQMFTSGPTLELGSYDRSFARGWATLDSRLSVWRAGSGLWDTRADARRITAMVLGVLAALGGAVGAAAGGLLAGIGAASAAWLVLAVAGGLLAGAGLAAAVGGWELRVRTAAGSALWLRVESFRRFLAQSEGYHADEAAKRGVLREYTAWAVAVGEIGRWTQAVNASTIAPQVAGVHYAYMAPFLLASTTSTATAPSSSGSGGLGGGGFGGGSVGGGAGGGGGGSW